jgi:hypothetical protein
MRAPGITIYTGYLLSVPAIQGGVVYSSTVITTCVSTKRTCHNQPLLLYTVFRVIFYKYNSTGERFKAHDVFKHWCPSPGFRF